MAINAFTMQLYYATTSSFLLSIYKSISYYQPTFYLTPFIYIQMSIVNKDGMCSTRAHPEKVASKHEKSAITMSKSKMSFRQGGAMLAVLICFAMVGINITLLSPSLTRIAIDLGNLDGRQWIVTSYMITYLTILPISGKVHTCIHIISTWVTHKSTTNIKEACYP